MKSMDRIFGGMSSQDKKDDKPVTERRYDSVVGSPDTPRPTCPAFAPSTPFARLLLMTAGSDRVDVPFEELEEAYIRSREDINEENRAALDPIFLPAEAFENVLPNELAD